MNTTEFKSIMNSVSPEMVAAYEWNNLEGVTLESVCAEYDSVKGNPNEKLRKWHNFFNLHIVITIFVFLSFSFFANTVSCAIATIVCLLPVLYFAFFKKEQLDKGCEILKKCNGIFDGFRDAVKALNPVEIPIVLKHSKDSVRVTLVMLAEKILSAEATLNRIRLLPKCYFSEIAECVDSKRNSQTRFDIYCLFVKSTFGIEFPKSELFAHARRRIENLTEILRPS
jgi:hypothetical protein